MSRQNLRDHKNFKALNACVSPIIGVRTDLAVLPELWSVSVWLELGPPRHHHLSSTAKKKRQQLSAVKPFVRCQLHSRASYAVALIP